LNVFNKHPVSTRLLLLIIIAASGFGMHALLQRSLPNLGILTALAVIIGASAAMLVMSFWPQAK
jgi:CHASE2 domain-containing sensor protein